MQRELETGQCQIFKINNIWHSQNVMILISILASQTSVETERAVFWQDVVSS